MSYELGDYLKEARGDLSLREAAKRSENTDNPISHTMISSIEKGVNSRGNEIKPTPENLQTLATIYHVNFLTLMAKAGYLGSMQLAGEPKVTVEGAEQLIEDATDYVSVYGTIHAGEAKFADRNIIGRVSLAPSFVHKYGRLHLFALQVKGDSMNKRIPDGFAAVFCNDLQVENGDIVAVLIDHQDATVKRYRKTSTAVMFEPDSYDPAYQPYIFQKAEEQDYTILGKYLFSTDIAI